ncbi:MAG TPA: MarR family transcriptional regulator [Candidatus Dormibacteraeota bacterium]|jgi:DNA-binding MarR family transcriptional regulator|nr:MarR family transcriptional regulator [Candidatus Dormibacteraeota bacterium]
MATTTRAEVRPDLFFLLSQASYALMTELTAALERLGISQRGYCVLSKARMGELTQIQLAELCALDKTTMVVTIDELERAGLAHRRLSTTDRRVRIISVTPDGATVLAEADRIVDRIYDEVLGSLPVNERDCFISSLDRLVAGRLATPVHTERRTRSRGPRAAHAG